MFKWILLLFICTPASSELALSEAGKDGVNQAQHNYITVITGTGRTGTTLMMAIFTCAGLKTGIKNNVLANFLENGMSGMEVGPPALLSEPYDPEKSPSIVKSPLVVEPRFFNRFMEWCSMYDSFRCHLVIPLRPTADAARSRLNLTMDKGWRYPGSLRAGNEEKQRRNDQQALENILLAVTEHEMYVDFLSYPKWVQDVPYFYRKLEPFFQRHHISIDTIAQCRDKYFKKKTH